MTGSHSRLAVWSVCSPQPDVHDCTITYTQANTTHLQVHLRDKPISSDIDYTRLAVLTGGMSGAQIAGVANAACFIASREGRADVAMEDMVKAIEQSRFGKVRAPVPGCAPLGG